MFAEAGRRVCVCVCVCVHACARTHADKERTSLQNSPLPEPIKEEEPPEAWPPPERLTTSVETSLPWPWPDHHPSLNPQTFEGGAQAFLSLCFGEKESRVKGSRRRVGGGIFEKMTSEQIPERRRAEDQQRQSLYGGGRLRGSSNHHPA